MDTTVFVSLGEDSKVRTLMLKPHDCYKKEDIHFKTRAITSSKNILNKVVDFPPLNGFKSR